MTKIVLLDSDTFPDWVATEPNPAWSTQREIDWVSYPKTDEDSVVLRCQGAEIVISNKVPISASAIASLPDLKCIAVAATGYNNVDIAAASARDIAVCNVQEYAKHAVAEHVLALLFTLAKDIKAYDQAVQAGAWQQSEQFCFYTKPVFDLHGKQLGIIGSGSLGRSVGALASALGMRVVYADRKSAQTPDVGKMAFDEVMRSSDAITIHCPLTPETKDLIGVAEFQMMEKKPVLINTARGGIVNESAAVEAIKQNQISALGFDVLTQEPPSEGNPLLSIANRANVIVTPHVAWATKEAMQEVWRQTIENIDLYFNQQFSRKVN